MNKYIKLKHDNINKISFIIAYSQNVGKLKQNFNCNSSNIRNFFKQNLPKFHIIKNYIKIL